MITLQDFCRYLEEYLQPANFSDYCPNGLQVEGKEEINKVAFSVSASLAVIDAAIAAKAEALVVHHGIFWQRDPFPIVGIKKEKIAKLLAHGISLIAYHLPLDAHPVIGNNWKAAMDLGMTNLQPFYAGEKVALGVKGNLQNISRNQFKEQLQAYYQHPAQVAFGGNEAMKSAAIISGGAWRYLKEAAAENIDCFVTGSCDEPAWDIAHEAKINFYALGHWATETVGVQALKIHLQSKFNLQTVFLELPNPF